MKFPLKLLDTVSGVSLWDVELSKMELQKPPCVYGMTIEKLLIEQTKCSMGFF